MNKEKDNLPIIECHLETASGQAYNPFDPAGFTISIDEMILTLSNVCRFGGHLPKHYSVLHHSLFVYWTLREIGASTDELMQGLVHDFSEAYLGDIPSPMKRTPVFDLYRQYEKQLQAEIFRMFGVPETELPLVKEVDRWVTAIENRYLRSATDFLDTVEVNWVADPERILDIAFLKPITAQMNAKVLLKQSLNKKLS